MQYRTFGRTGFKPSALGFGAMRLPRQGDGLDVDESIRMIRRAIDGGVNYIDTAYGYCDGRSESIVGQALQDGYRGRVHLATKLPPWQLKGPADMDRIFDEQRERLQTDCIDCYLMHGLGTESWKKMQEFSATAWAEKRRARGQIRYLGFSFHDSAEAFAPIVDGYGGWDFCQLQFNYMDVENQAGTAGVRYAAQKGLAVVVMEPLLGGRLAASPPAVVARVWADAPSVRTPADWALQWLWDQPEVSLLLSGMSTMEQVEQNLASAKRARVHGLTDAERALVDRVRAAYHGMQRVPCTECGYCQPCAEGVNIPRIFGLANSVAVWGGAERGRRDYAQWREAQGAGRCVNCGVCVEKCPQRIEIPGQLAACDADLRA